MTTKPSAFKIGITLVPDPYEMLHPVSQELVFSHRPIVPLEPDILNLHGHIHNNLAPELGSQHINMFVEVREYRPWRLCDVLRPGIPITIPEHLTGY